MRDSAAFNQRVISADRCEGTLRVYYAWQNALVRSREAQTPQNLIRIPTPVIQAWSASTYQRSLELTLEVWERWVAPPTLIGVGSVCRRSLSDPQHGLFAILDRLEYASRPLRACPQGLSGISACMQQAGDR